MPLFAASDLVLHCLPVSHKKDADLVLHFLPVSHKKDARLIWVNVFMQKMQKRELLQIV